MSELISISEDRFKSEVLDSTVPVLVEFGAPWCVPCKRLEPVLAQLGAEWGDKIRLRKIDVDASVQTVMQYQVMSVPTLILFVKGQPQERLSGFQPRDKIVDRVEPHLS